MSLELNGTTGVQGNSGAFVAGTAVTASGTSVDFTSIPSWVKRITVMFNQVSTNGTSLIILQIGSGSVTTSGYSSSASTNGATTSLLTSGFIVSGRGDTSNSLRGSVTLSLISSNTFVSFGGTGNNTSNGNFDIWSVAGFSPTLGGALDRVRVTTVNGTDTFDAGSINILYE